tara:strand:+ start:454 stop:1371 length:918 start_codon:yes stop_codon:yes gene_type:complete
MILNFVPKVLKRHTIIRILIKVFSSFKYQTFTCNNIKVFSNLQDAEARQVYIKNHFEDYGYFSLSKYFLTSGGIHFDIGANYGFQTFGMIERFVNDQVKFFLIEPNLDCHHCHIKTLELNPNIDIQSYKKAFYSYEGEAHFQYCRENSGGGSVFKSLKFAKIDKNTLEEHSYKIKCTTLDAFLVEKQIDSVDLMKIDVEGSEFDLLCGAQSSLSDGKIKAAYIEINSEALKDHEQTPSQIFKLLEKFNYKLFFPHANAKTGTEVLKLNEKKLSLSKLDKEDIINRSRLSHTLLDILAIHPSIIKD